MDLQPLRVGLCMAAFFCLGAAVWAQEGRPERQPNRGNRPSAGAAVQTGRAAVKPPGRNDAAFATRLGENVGLRAVPSAGFAPGVLPPGAGNINHPGMQPMPSAQPLPTGLPRGTPHINFPGGTPEMNAPFSGGRFGHPGHPGRHHSGKPGLGPARVVVGIPYYVPYVVYIGGSPASTTQEAPATGPGSGITSYSPPAPGTPLSDEPKVSPTPTITLLAFEDGTILAVTDYWLEGNLLVYETSRGTRTYVPLERLDLALTQQLNRERNVRFVLEAR